MGLIGGGAAPFVTPETRPFWDAVAQDRLLIPRCADCGSFYFPPSPICPKCTSRNVEWADASGEATLYSFMIAQNPWPEWGVDGPMSIAHVALAEGPRLISTVVDCPQTPEALKVDMPLLATFRPFGDQKMLCFKPCDKAGAAS